MSVADSLKLIGTTVADKYAVEAVVGEGGFAVVYRAKHVIWKRPVAIKVFKALGDFDSAHRTKLMDEFVQEGALLAELSERSAAIVQARDIGMLTTAQGEQIPYMVLEWLEGSSLEAVLDQEKTASPRRVPRTVAESVKLLEPAAEALALAHMKGIAHRDVKPGNIFLLGDPNSDACTVKLLDFGIAKVVSDVQKMAGSFTKTGGQVTAFTPAYGAPEQFSRTHGATGPWTDVFALALILVELVSGREALEGDDFVQLAVASGSMDRRPTPRALKVEVTDAVEAVFAKALAVKTTERYAAAGEFWNALHEALGMAPMRGVTTTDPRRSGVRSEMATASTVAVPESGPLSGSASPSLVTASATNRTPGRGGANGALIAVGVVAVLAIGGGGAFFALSGKTPASGAAGGSSALASAPGASASVAPIASAKPGCPADMIAIPGGQFFMGSEDAVNEKPHHQVTLAPFCIDKFEVTTEQYKACSDTGGCSRAAIINDLKTYPMTPKEHTAYDPLCNAREPEARAKHPINCIDWDQAVKYCKGQGKRLPTEAEWEFSARGPDGRKYPWGDEEPTSTLINACDKRCQEWAKKSGVNVQVMFTADDGWAATAPVGSFPKGGSRYGVEDVVGNVWEWVADHFAPYAKDEQTDPKGPESGEFRVIRGGAWNGGDASWVRPTFRWRDDPMTRSHGVGFRCAK